MNQNQLIDSSEMFRQYYEQNTKFFSILSKKELLHIVAYQNAMVLMSGD
tara:strand:+ start:361 stop:507 length:147 start_codon:yes stop_codon:yes gene_type:complete